VFALHLKVHAAQRAPCLHDGPTVMAPALVAIVLLMTYLGLAVGTS
jgi:hypothetical protein